MVTIYYPEAKQMEALKLAQTLRKEKNVVMKVWTKEDVEVVAWVYPLPWQKVVWKKTVAMLERCDYGIENWKIKVVL